MGGLDTKAALEAICAPGFWLLSPDTAKAGFLGRLEVSTKPTRITPLETNGDLRGPRVRMRWNKPVAGYVDTGHGYAHGIDPGQIRKGGEGDTE
ncbi:hypothetical protein V6N12_020974 [Hibiscus sabdariffa]|uniref:Uncharacterized protein n=1 Tax=Hibiscus sabdariffa TaxID=183260 RepID=A0ABR2D016_9ROSI